MTTTTIATKTAAQYRAESAQLRDFSLEQLHLDLPLRFPSHGGGGRTRVLPRAQLVQVSRLGYTPSLELIYAADAIPIVDIRSAPNDQDADYLH